MRIYSAAVPLSEDVGEPGDERVPCVIEVEPTYAHNGWLSDDVEHIVRWEPARVLAECEAKRRIVGRHAQCDDVSYGDASTCPDMCTLAAVYADHDDYREEWRP